MDREGAVGADGGVEVFLLLAFGEFGGRLSDHKMLRRFFCLASCGVGIADCRKSSRTVWSHCGSCGRSLMLSSRKMRPQAKTSEVRMRFMANDNSTDRRGISESVALRLASIGLHVVLSEGWKERTCSEGTLKVASLAFPFALAINIPLDCCLIPDIISSLTVT